MHKHWQRWKNHWKLLLREPSWRCYKRTSEAAKPPMGQEQCSRKFWFLWVFSRRSLRPGARYIQFTNMSNSKFFFHKQIRLRQVFRSQDRVVAKHFLGRPTSRTKADPPHLAAPLWRLYTEKLLRKSCQKAVQKASIAPPDDFLPMNIASLATSRLHLWLFIVITKKIHKTS